MDGAAVALYENGSRFRTVPMALLQRVVIRGEVMLNSSVLGALAAKFTAGILSIAGTARAFLQSTAANSVVQILGNRNATDTGADVETNGQALVEAVRNIPGRVHLCLEEGTQSAWLYELLAPHVVEAVVVATG